jgi:hypothetical protein
MTMRATGMLVALLLLSPPIARVKAQQQRQTIPQAIAEGAVNSVSTVPSGQVPTIAALLRNTDIIATGTVGEPRSYLSDDQRDVYTDYPIVDPVFLFQSQSAPMPKPGIMPTLIVTQLGGTVAVNGTRFTQKEPALAPLEKGTRALFMLQQTNGHNFIAGRYFGVFGVTETRLVPLVARQDFAPEYRTIHVSSAIDTMLATLRERE